MLNSNTQNINSASWLKSCLKIGLFTLAITAMISHDPSGTLRSEAYAVAISTCGDCHGNPPVDGTRDGTTGQFIGSHTKHTGSATGQYSYACSKCHYDNGTTNYKHQTGFINITGSSLSGDIYSQSAATHKKAVANTGIVYGTCSKSNFYCHSAGTSLTTAVAPLVVPTWSTSNGAVSCSGCHGNTSANLTTGSHIKHAPLGCPKCHTTAASANSIDPLYITQHVNKLVEINISNSSAASGATYNAVNVYQVNYAKPVGTAFSNCTNIKCHNDGTSIWLATTGMGNTPNWGTTGGCNSCHGNNKSYYGAGDWRKAFPLYSSYPQVASHKPNSHQHHADVRGANAGPTCAMCHYGITTDNTTAGGASGATHSTRASYETTASGANIKYDFGNDAAYVAGGTPANVAFIYTAGTKPAAASCSAVSCHPTGLAGNPTWSESNICTNCHKVDLQNTNGYHHAMNNYSTGNAYPTAVPQGDATSGTNPKNRRCTMCHVNHDIFSPLLNATQTDRSKNLRSNITLAPTKTAGFANSDFIADGTGGICISCHNAELTKSPTNLKVETSSTKTPAIVYADFNGAAHKYNVASAMKNDGGNFQSNCSKCHNGRVGEVAVFSKMTTAVHDNAVRRNYASLGGALVDGHDEDFCYRCHSKTSDSNPGGGPAKTVANKDYYKTVAMSSKAEGIFAVFQKTSKHNVSGYTGFHKPSPTDETAAYITANRHVECADCHDPHAATNSNAINGVSGLDPTIPAAGATPTYTVLTVNNPDHQYKVCFKCHTNWAGVGTGTNLAVEFNTNNVSYHWVENDKGVAKASTSYGNFNTTYVYKMMPRYNGFTDAQLRSVKMRCSDCHGPDGADGGVTVPEGPHGSNIAKILKVPSGSPYNTWNNSVNRTSSNVWCWNCHDQNFTNTGFSGESSNSHTDGRHDNNCQYCHISVPHGSGTLKRLLNPSTFRTGINSINSGSLTQSNGHGQVIPGCT